MSQERPTCGYCGKPLPPRTGRGAHQAYCSPDEKRRLDRALYFFGRHQLETGVITLADIHAFEQTLPKAASRPRSRRKRIARSISNSTENNARTHSELDHDVGNSLSTPATRSDGPFGHGEQSG